MTTNPYQAPETEEFINPNNLQGKKSRHGCLTAYLILMIIANSGTFLLYLYLLIANVANFPAWTIPVLCFFGVVNLTCSIALLKLKKWGFYGFVASSIVVTGVNVLSGIAISSSFGGLIGIAILFGVLQIGKENKGWTQLD
ncbi:MAG: hypothetical protein GY829_05145 [Gammaproteobacteria bacterium]|nr:hypothetical protein [Gammaproteobacteria bacterium]